MTAALEQFPQADVRNGNALDHCWTLIMLDRSPSLGQRHLCIVTEYQRYVGIGGIESGFQVDVGEIQRFLW